MIQSTKHSYVPKGPKRSFPNIYTQRSLHEQNRLLFAVEMESKMYKDWSFMIVTDMIATECSMAENSIWWLNVSNVVFNSFQ